MGTKPTKLPLTDKGYVGYPWRALRTQDVLRVLLKRAAGTGVER
jgi:hypothetical protein